MTESFDVSRPLRQKEELEHSTRVIVMLGSRMVDPKDSGEWKFPLFVNTQTNVGTSLPGEVSGGWSRMRAVQSEYKKGDEESNHKTVVLVTGGREPDGSSRSEEAAKELSERYKLPTDSIHSIGGIGATMGNAAAAAEYVHTHAKELGKVEKVDLVTNDYHMLRAWLMFSQGMLKRTANKELEVSEQDKTEVNKILQDASPDKEGWSPEKVRETREKVMKILSPYFTESKIRIEPVVVEEALENSSEGSAGKGRYARMLRNNKWVKETLRFEYKGTIDLLEGKYKGS